MRNSEVTILRSGNRIVIDPTTPRIRRLIEPKLTYTQKIFHRGKEKWRRKKEDLPLVEEQDWECFADDHKGRLGTSFGFYERIHKILTKRGYKVKLRWATKAERLRAEERAEKTYKPRWDRIDALVENGFEFRYMQRECLEVIANNENGRIDCHGGWGKGTEIMLACVLYPKANIAVITKRVPVLQQRLYPELALNLPSVGIVGGGKKVKGRRVMCYSADSMHHCTGEEDIVFVDEGHEACADKFAESMSKFDHARVFMFSASWDMRLDNKDLRGEAMAGPIRIRVPYHKGVEHGIVVPIEIIWSDVVMDLDPCSDLDDVDKKRAGIWANEYRNSLIARDAHLHDDDTQVLITVETLEHALYLKKLLPEFELIYSPDSQKPKDWQWFKRQGLIGSDFRIITDQRRQRFTRQFEKGKLKKAIATPVWNVGVNFRRLQVLIRGDAGGSPVNDTQIPARNARPHLEGWEKKQVAIIHDYRDQFNVGYSMKAAGRSKSYKKNRWAQHFPEKNRKTLLRKLMGWGK